MRIFLNIVLLLSVSGISLTGLAPLIVLFVELMEDPYVIGATCSIQQQGVGTISVEAWYRGSLQITDVNISIGYGGKLFKWKSQDLLDRHRNASLTIDIPGGNLDPKRAQINVTAKLGGLYTIQIAVRGC
ncbi:MAG: hypothetical protein RQ885_01525 [Desulfurococcales archaeon]|nr:hypothetical protein [Desulfurococcales archaeon]